MAPTLHVRPTRSWPRLDGIDGLRALAIFFVLMNHVNMRLLFAHIHYLKGLPPQLANSLVWQGQSGVQIFFAVSGFLITSTSLRRWTAPNPLRIRDFYALRFARIAPLLFALLAILSLLHILHWPDFVVAKTTGGLPAALLAALTFRIGLLEATRGYLPANWDILWSLSVEETFYLFFPLALRLLGRGKKLILLLAIFVVLGPFGRTLFTHGNEVWQEYSYLGGMDAIALGCLTALYLHVRSLSRTTLRIFLLAGSALLFACLGLSRQLSRLHLDQTGLTMTLLAIGTCLLIAVAAQTTGQAPRLLSSLLAFGRRSYEIYLLHMFVVFACFHTFMNRGHALGLVVPLFLAVFALSGLLGEIVGRFFTEPVNHWLRTRLGVAHEGHAADSARSAQLPELPMHERP